MLYLVMYNGFGNDPPNWLNVPSSLYGKFNGDKKNGAERAPSKYALLSSAHGTLRELLASTTAVAYACYMACQPQQPFTLATGNSQPIQSPLC